MTKRALVVLRLPVEMKQRLDTLRSKGFTLNGLITHLIRQELERTDPTAAPTQRKGR